MQALEDMTGQAGSLLQQLGLPYQVIVLCGGDMGFWRGRNYDISVVANLRLPTVKSLAAQTVVTSKRAVCKRVHQR